MQNSGRPDIRKTRRKLSILLFAVSTAILAGGFFYYRNYRAALMLNTERLLHGVTSFKTDQLLEWRNDRLQRAASLLDSPVLSVHLNKLAANHNDLQTADLLRRRLESFLYNNQYKSAVLATPDGRMLVKVGSPPKRLCPDALELLKRAPRSPEMSDLHEQPDTGTTYGIHVAGLAGTAPGGARIFLILGIDPKDHLYPLVQKWPGPSRTAETLLVRREGEKVVFLNELRHQKGTALKLRLDLHPTLPAAMAVMGRHGMVRGTDYRGKDVFAYLNHIDEFGWAMVTKVDADEILADYNRISALLLLLVLALLAASAAGTFLFLRIQEESYSREIAATNAKLRESEQIFSEFMEHSPIYVFFKDENIRSLRLSRNYEKMIGRPLGELLGKNMNELFPSDLAQKMVADDLKILREGKETSIEEEFNGRHYVTTKFPIKPEGKPAYLAGYTIDVTEQKRNEGINAARIRLLDFAASHSLDEVLEATLNEAEALSGSAVGFYHFLEADQKTLSLQNWSTRTKAQFCKAEGKGRHYPVAEAGVWTDCIRERKPVIHNDYASLPHRKGLPPGHAPVIRELVVPVFRGESIVAILGVGNKATDYDQTDVEVVSLFANLVWDIAERKKAEEQAARMSERVVLAASAAKFGIWDWDIPSNRLTWDDKMFDIYGVARESFPGAYEAWLSGIHPEDRARCDEESRRALAGEQAYDTEFRIVRPDGELRWLKASADIFKGADGKTKRMVGVNFDITDIRRAEEKLRESEERLRVTLEETQIGTWDWDVTKDAWQASPTYFTMLGYKPEPGPSDRKVWLGRVHPEDREHVASKIASVLGGTDAKYQYEARMLHADGTYRWHLVLGTTVKKGPSGKPARMMGVRIDINQRKIAEEALRKSERDLMDAQRLARIGNWTLDLVSNKLYWSDVIYRIFEIDKEKFGASYEAFLDAIHPEDRERVNKAYTDSVKNKTKYDISHRLLMKDGRIKHVNEFCETFYDPAGKPVKSIGTVQDITERKAAEDALRESEERLRSLWTHMAEGVALHELVCGTNGRPENYRIIETNPQFESILGIKTDHVAGKLATEAYGTPAPPYLEEYTAVAVSGKPASMEVYFEPLNRYFSISIAPWGTKGFATIFSDITARKKAELETEKLNRELINKNQEMENFLYITTHDLRSPLVNIQGFSQNLQHYQAELDGIIRNATGLQPNDEARLKELTAVKVPEALDFVLGSSRKMDALITALLKVSRIGRVEMKPEKVQMGELLSSVLDAMRFQLEESGAVVEIGALPPCRADQGAVSQVFTNLLDNAVKYRDTSRSLKIEVSGEVRGDSAFYKVADNGPGIAEKDLNRIWNVFYRHERTTDRGGEGIGLPMVRRIVERNGGNIRAESQEGKGTVFYVQLPAVREG